MNRRRLAPAGFALAVVCTPSALAREDPDSLARYIVFEIDQSGVVRPQRHQIVRLSAPVRSLTEAEVWARMAERPRDVDRVSVRLLDSRRRVVHRDVVEIPRWLRAELGPDGSLTRFPGFPLLAKRSFVLRVPVLKGVRIALLFRSRERLSGEVAPRDSEFDLDAIAADTSLPLTGFAPRVEPRSGASAGNSGNRADLLLMGDGYTSSQAAQFDSDVGNILAGFFNISPYDTYRNFVNVSTLFTASAQAGADHPTYSISCPPTFPVTCCADPLMQSDPLNGTFVNTAFDASYCYLNIYRLLYLDTTKVLAAAAAAPDWDRVLVIVNDPTYGGSGGYVSVVSTNQFAVGIAQHEYGHSFTGLADEYSDPYPGYPACSDTTGPACEANVTNQTNRSLIKWFPWIEPSTPVPTPNEVAYSNVVGLFEGARFQSSDMYRPRLNCLMRTLQQPFCEICSQEYVLRLYRGGWGIPASGIENIEPGSESPAPGPVSSSFPGNITFTVDLLQPIGGPNLSVNWLVNGTPVPGATSNSYTFVPSGPGNYQVELRTKDVTPLVDTAMAGTSLDDSRVWTVAVATGPTSFYTLTPCRIADTRNANGPLGGPALAAGATRDFPVSGLCALPPSAKAVAVNVTVVNPTVLGHLTVYPAGAALPLASTINFRSGIVRANNAVVPLGADGQISVFCGMPSGSTDFILDVSGYFE